MSWTAHRLSELPPYLFVEIDRKKREAIAAGREVIDFGVGDPDQPTPEFIVRAMGEALKNAAHHRYPAGAGGRQFREAVGEFFERRFGVRLDPTSQILALIGSKEGLGHFPTAVVNPGETVLIPDPGYPVYTGGTIFAGGVCHYMALREGASWLPDLEGIDASTASAAKLMFLNYPNNPTAACAPMEFLEKAVAFARRHKILIAQDAAYSEMFFEKSRKPASILQIPGAMDCAVEFHSLSKTFNMTGWRVGFAVGNAEALAALAKVKNNIDSGVFGAIQAAGITALSSPDEQLEPLRRTYMERRDVLVDGLISAGWSVQRSAATFYVWARCPSENDSMGVAARLLNEADVVAIPGIGFGAAGEGYVRFALTVSKEKTSEAVGRITRLSW